MDRRPCLHSLRSSYISAGMIFDAASKDHYGLEDVKERILEHIAVSFLKAREGKRESELDQYTVHLLDSPLCMCWETKSRTKEI